jgi:hypothetical protein
MAVNAASTSFELFGRLAIDSRRAATLERFGKRNTGDIADAASPGT